MFQLVWNIISYFIDKWGDIKIKQADTALERERIQAQTEQSKDKWKAVILTSTGAWWFQLFFIVPLAIWFSAVVIYSVFWCSGCMYPQPWSIAALPHPLNDWAGVIIGFLFLANLGRK